jgi:hypothetical protein
MLTRAEAGLNTFMITLYTAGEEAAMLRVNKGTPSQTT